MSLGMTGVAEPPPVTPAAKPCGLEEIAEALEAAEPDPAADSEMGAEGRPLFPLRSALSSSAQGQTFPLFCTV